MSSRKRRPDEPTELEYRWLHRRVLLTDGRTGTVARVAQTLSDPDRHGHRTQVQRAWVALDNGPLRNVTVDTLTLEMK